MTADDRLSWLSSLYRDDSLTAILTADSLHHRNPRMPAEIESLVLEHLRAIRATQGDHTERFTRLESRINSLELVVAGMRRDLSHMYGDIVEQHAHMDQLTARVERLERRLELHDG